MIECTTKERRFPLHKYRVKIFRTNNAKVSFYPKAFPTPITIIGPTEELVPIFETIATQLVNKNGEFEETLKEA